MDDPFCFDLVEEGVIEMITSCCIVIFQEKTWRAGDGAGQAVARQRKTPFPHDAGTAFHEDCAVAGTAGKKVIS